MALELESIIMDEVGLGNHFNWYNGSGSCRFIREKAVEKVQPMIQKHHDGGDLIAPPDKELMDTLKRVAASEDSPYDLTKTWQAMSYVIAIHIHQAKSSGFERIKAYENLNKYIKNNYLFGAN